MAEQSSVIEYPEYITTLTKKVAKKEGFANIKIKISSGTNPGDGFMGLLVKIVVTGIKTKNGIAKEEILNLVGKLPPLNAVRREQFNSVVMFEREAFVYSEILPEFIKFQHEHLITRDQGFYSIPKCYEIHSEQSTDEYCIILEDLRSRNFCMFDKMKQVDYNHVKLLMEQLGRFHAISLVLKTNGNQKFEEWKKLPDIMVANAIKHPEQNDIMFNSALDKAIETLESNELEIKEKLYEFKRNMKSFLEVCFNPESSEPFTVLNHGDCWNNNMMYLYDENNSPKDICLYDWQVLRYASPALDLLYYMFISTNKSLRAEHYNNLLKVYYQNLSDHIKRLGGNPENLFTFKNLLEQLKKFGKFGVLMSTLLLQIILRESSELPDMDKLAQNFKDDPNTKFDFTSDISYQIYKTRIGDVLRDAFNYGYL